MQKTQIQNKNEALLSTVVLKASNITTNLGAFTQRRVCKI